MSLSTAENHYEELSLNAYKCLLDLTTADGINASSESEIYGCIFGRDSAITILKILKVLSSDKKRSHIDSKRLTQICKTALSTLVELQGRVVNIESGEEPGKFIHEYRTKKYEHLINRPIPWYLYPDKKLRNYDSIDSTPLTLIAIYRYYELTKDGAFLVKALPAVERGLNWIITYGDSDKDYLLEYEFKKERKFGGLLVQSWTDSHESLRQTNGKMPVYPIAPVEVQGYAWLALKIWADFYKHSSPRFAQTLETRAQRLKKKFNEKFIYKKHGVYFAAQALNGVKTKIKTVTGNSLLLLWATYEKNGKKESVIYDEYIPDLVKRSFMRDLFDEDAGIRTMSALSKTFNPKQDSYHNGSFWPMLNSMIHEGLLFWNYRKEAKDLHIASIKPIQHFKSPIELYIKNGDKYQEFIGKRGQTGCRYQAWSAAAALDLANY